jgi:hypothetical protein
MVSVMGREEYGVWRMEYKGVVGESDALLLLLLRWNVFSGERMTSSKTIAIETRLPDDIDHHYDRRWEETDVRSDGDGGDV